MRSMLQQNLSGQYEYNQWETRRTEFKSLLLGKFYPQSSVILSK